MMCVVGVVVYIIKYMICFVPAVIIIIFLRYSIL